MSDAENEMMSELERYHFMDVMPSVSDDTDIRQVDGDYCRGARRLLFGRLPLDHGPEFRGINCLVTLIRRIFVDFREEDAKGFVDNGHPLLVAAWKAGPLRTRAEHMQLHEQLQSAAPAMQEQATSFEALQAAEIMESTLWSLPSGRMIRSWTRPKPNTPWTAIAGGSTLIEINNREHDLQGFDVSAAIERRCGLSRRGNGQVRISTIIPQFVRVIFTPSDRDTTTLESLQVFKTDFPHGFPTARKKAARFVLAGAVRYVKGQTGSELVRLFTQTGLDAHPEYKLDYNDLDWEVGAPGFTYSLVYLLNDLDDDSLVDVTRKMREDMRHEALKRASAENRSHVAKAQQRLDALTIAPKKSKRSTKANGRKRRKSGGTGPETEAQQAKKPRTTEPVPTPGPTPRSNQQRPATAADAANEAPTSPTRQRNREVSHVSDLDAARSPMPPRSMRPPASTDSLQSLRLQTRSPSLSAPVPVAGEANSEPSAAQSQEPESQATNSTEEEARFIAKSNNAAPARWVKFAVFRRWCLASSDHTEETFNALGFDFSPNLPTDLDVGYFRWLKKKQPDLWEAKKHLIPGARVPEPPLPPWPSQAKTSAPAALNAAKTQVSAAPQAPTSAAPNAAKTSAPSAVQASTLARPLLPLLKEYCRRLEKEDLGLVDFIKWHRRDDRLAVTAAFMDNQAKQRTAETDKRAELLEELMATKATLKDAAPAKVQAEDAGRGCALFQAE
ncbi:hypothetical protein Cob_v012667 [Colletotrichum orbiculare MAFF 240422]|uniref:Uncharacterized protein n=1 Tax=Colletotrichum orbiculare (strain 104-T / ATCC 96160 / CBS 514.97 / LARS 414 / MAFF 240422) TaxID=1213857 RepID=N4VBT3_COLOR|nr:hypothetical protein Cob_v012667 [Colletotrichum orbiculare MAFF 240422]